MRRGRASPPLLAAGAVRSCHCSQFRSSPSASDPVGDMLARSSKPSARVGVEAHFQINRRGNHTAIPETFVKALPPVTKRTIAMATRLAEVGIRLDSGLSQAVLKYL